MKNIGIYIHIPFCKRKCHYCDFISFSGEQKLIEQYIESLKREINNYKINKENYLINTIYFGGGTPSFIDSLYIVEIINILKQKFNISKDAEITIEINPGTVDEQKLNDYYNSGINRISFGLQSTRSELLKLVGRIHSYSSFLDAYNSAVVDTPTSSFTGNSAIVDIGDNTRIYQVIIIIAILICLPLIWTLIRNLFSATKKQQNDNENDE